MGKERLTIGELILESQLDLIKFITRNKNNELITIAREQAIKGELKEYFKTIIGIITMS